MPLFCIALEKPLKDWINQACQIAYENSDETEHTLELVTEVDTRGWTIQQVAEWAVKNLVSEEDPCTSQSFVILDKKSERTNSFIIVGLKESSFEKVEGKEPDVQIE